MVLSHRAKFQHIIKFFPVKAISTQPKGIHHKSVELWFHIIIWCHRKMVTPGAGRSPQRRD